MRSKILNLDARLHWLFSGHQLAENYHYSKPAVEKNLIMIAPGAVFGGGGLTIQVRSSSARGLGRQLPVEQAA